MNHIYDTLKKLIDQTKRKPAMHIYKDEETGHIKEELLSKIWQQVLTSIIQ
jgi:hypothetical protein